MDIAVENTSQMPIDNSLTWLIAGLLLIIFELMTGTFYLLVLGVAAVASAGLAYAGSSFMWQAIVAPVVTLAGLVVVQRYKGKVEPKRMQGIDYGQPATFESWVNQDASLARVKYRDSLWDALIIGEAEGKRGEILYVNAIDGNSLKVSKTRPA